MAACFDNFQDGSGYQSRHLMRKLGRGDLVAIPDNHGGRHLYLGQEITAIGTTNDRRLLTIKSLQSDPHGHIHNRRHQGRFLGQAGMHDLGHHARCHTTEFLGRFAVAHFQMATTPTGLFRTVRTRARGDQAQMRHPFGCGTCHGHGQIAPHRQARHRKTARGARENVIHKPRHGIMPRQVGDQDRTNGGERGGLVCP